MIPAFIAAFFISTRLWAAACCGGNNLFPSLISGDEKAQITATTAYSSVVGDALVSGAFVGRSSDDGESRATLRLDFAALLSDRWQMGLSVPVVRRIRTRPNAQAEAVGLGDLGIMLAYEAFPQWSYSAWKPKGLLFLSLGLPTGRSALDSQMLFQIDAMGRGYWVPGIGALFQKAWDRWDAIFTGQVTLPLPRALSTPAGNFGLTPSLGGSASLGMGWSWDDLRLGALLTAQYEGPVRTTGLVEETGSSQLSFPLTLQASYLISPAWSLTALYSDSSLVNARNVPIARALSLMLQTRWDR